VVSEWLVSHASRIPKGARVLDVASGAGRHAIYLAAHGYAVHAVDRSAEALAALAAIARDQKLPITTEVLDLESPSVAFPRAAFGGVIGFNYLHRPLFPALRVAVAPGGVLIYETFTRGQAERGHPKNPAFLLNAGELSDLVQPFTIVAAREGEFAGKSISSIVAMRLVSDEPLP